MSTRRFTMWEASPQRLNNTLDPLSPWVEVVSIDWKETKKEHVLKAELPGVKKEDVKVEMINDGRILQISGHKKKRKCLQEDKPCTWHCNELTHGGFSRRISLPQNVTLKVDEAKATMKDGILTIIVPKGQPREPHLTSIQISG